MADPSRRHSTNKEQVGQVIAAYLQKRNYPKSSPADITETRMKLTMLVEKEVSRPNSVAYTSYSSDPIIVDHSFSKFIYWVKDMQSKSKDHQDLDVIVAPLFCHLYIELQQKKEKDKDVSNNFFKFHLPNVEKFICNDSIRSLLTAISSDSMEAGILKTNFRSCKFRMNICTKSAAALKKYLAENSHVVLLQMFQTWFDFDEGAGLSDDEMEIETPKDVMNGYMSGQGSSVALKNIFDAINAVKNETPPVYTVSLSNVKDDVNCGIIDRELGIAVYSYNSFICVTSILTLKQLDYLGEVGDVMINGHSDRIYDVAVNKRTRHLISASNDKTVRLFNLQNYTHVHTYRGHNYPVYCVATSPNGCYIASGSYDNSCRLWSIESTESLRLYGGHTQEITALAFHPNSTYLISGSADKTARMWTINDGSPVRMFIGSKGVIYGASFSASGKYLATAGEENCIRVWDLTAGKLRSEIRTAGDPITRLVWNSNDNFLSAGTIDGTIKTWDVNVVLNNPEGHQDECVNSISLNMKLLDLESSFDTLGCLVAQNVSFCQST